MNSNNNLYPKLPSYKIVSTEEKGDFVKKNKKQLILPVDDFISDEKIDDMVYAIKNNWNMGGAELSEMLDQMYNILRNDSKPDSSND